MKKILSIVMMVALCLSIVSVAAFAAEGAQTIYVKPSTEWLNDGARFAAYFFGNGEKWLDCKDTNNDGIYEVEVPSGFSKVIFCRMNPNTTANNWNNKWNQTADLTVPAANATKNCYYVVGWDKGAGQWAAIDGELEEVKVTYHLVGNMNGWSASDSNMMTEKNGKWTITIHLAAGSYEYKVCSNTSKWFPDGNNLTFKLTTASDVLFTFDGSKVSHEVKGSSVTPTDPPATEPVTSYGDFFVAGTADLCGVGWDPGANQNKMTHIADGLYEITFKNVAAGSHEFKITDGTWDNAWGDNGNNYVLTLNAVSDVTISFNAVDKKITVTTKATGAVVKIDYYLVGINDDWTPSDSNKMTKGADGKWTIELKLAAGSYGYKVCSSTNQWFPDGMGNETKFTLDAASVVLFTFDPATGAHTWAVQSTEPTEPAPTEPEATEPKPTEPAPTEPETTEPAPTEPEATEPKDTVVVYAKVPADWTEVAVYVWDANGFAVAWPGSAMTLGADGWYTAEVPAWAANIIINNNNNGAQTQDMAIEMGRDLWIVVEASEGGFTGTVSYESAKTGDSTSLVGLAAAMLLSAAGLVVLTYKKKEI